MRSLGRVLSTALLAVCAATASGAGNVYPVHTAHNYCPTGMQPVTKDGTICCGVPTTQTTYTSMMAHTSHRPAEPARTDAVDCPIGEKGCR